MVKPLKPAGAVPDRSRLHEAALRHLSRFSATEAGLVRVLDRAVQRWAARAAAEGRETGGDVQAARAAAREVARGLVLSGAIDDGAFAQARARRLTRSGRSRRAIAAHLAAKGVGANLAGDALDPSADELPAALAYARRRRIGPFRTETTADSRQKDLAALGRAGFPRDVAERALGTGAAEADCLVLSLRQG